MRGWLALGLVALGFVAVPGNGGNGFGPAVPKELSWQTDFATARRLARLSGKPIFAVFR
jgi:hypothetical protein